MNRESLTIAVRAIIREILATPDDEPETYSPLPDNPPPHPAGPTPRFDFTPETDDPYAQAFADAREFIETAEPPPIVAPESSVQARARRIRERRFPEEMPMRGMEPPEDDG